MPDAYLDHLEYDRQRFASSYCTHILRSATFCLMLLLYPLRRPPLHIPKLTIKFHSMKLLDLCQRLQHLAIICLQGLVPNQEQIANDSRSCCRAVVWTQKSGQAGPGPRQHAQVRTLLLCHDKELIGAANSAFSAAHDLGCQCYLPMHRETLLSAVEHTTGAGVTKHAGRLSMFQSW